MKKLLFLALTTVILLCGCAPATPQVTLNLTSTPQPTAMITLTPLPTATLAPDYGPSYEKVQADPWTATDAEKSGYDSYVRQQLAAVGVKNAETLPDYELLEAVIEYQQALIAKDELENPEDYLIELPISLHELIRTDRNNLIPVHREASRDNAKYGIGGTSNPDLNDLLIFNSTLFYFTLYGKEIKSNTTQLPMNGDLVLLYKTPGFDSNVGIGAVIRMYDGTRVAYTEIFIPTSNAPINPGDLCLSMRYGHSDSVIACPTGIQRSQAAIVHGSGYTEKWKKAELNDWLEIMKNFKGVNVEIVPSGSYPILAHPMWSDGIQIIDNVRVVEIN